MWNGNYCKRRSNAHDIDQMRYGDDVASMGWDALKFDFHTGRYAARLGDSCERFIYLGGGE